MTPTNLARHHLTAARQLMGRLADGGPFRRATTAGTLYVVFALPWSDALPALDAVNTTLSFGLAGVAALAVLVEGRRRRLAEPQLLGTGFVIVAAMSSIWSIDAGLSLAILLPLMQILALLLLSWEFCPGREGAEALARAYVFGCGVVVAATLWTSSTGGAVIDNRLVVGSANQNDLSFILAMGIPIAWYLGELASTTVARWSYRLLVPTSLYVTVLLASRGGLAVGLLGTMIIPWCLVGGDRRRVYLAALALVAAVPLVPQLLPSAQLVRLSSTTDEAGEGTLNGRTQLWSAAFSTFSSHPIAGVGAGASRREFEERTGNDLRAHNTPLSIASELGAIGLASIGLFGLSIVHRARRTSGLDRKLLTAAGLVILVGLQVRHWEYQPALWAVLIILISLGPPPERCAQARRSQLTPRRSGIA